jgi:hypothetical protein
MDKSHQDMDIGRTNERLPFRIEVATPQNLSKVTALRAAAYGRHMPEFAAKLGHPEASDFEHGCEVFVAISKLDGTALGTLRTHANVHKPLPLQASMQLSERFNGTRMVETTRLSIAGGVSSSVVRSALFKALHQYCLQQNVDWMLAAGRRPVDRIYDALLFKDVNEPGAYYPMSHAGGVPHRVMSLAPDQVQPLWAAQGQSLYGFFFETVHPDIDLSGARNLSHSWSCPVAFPSAPKAPVKVSTPLFSSPWPSLGMGLTA